MAKIQVDLPVPAGNGVGAAVDTSKMGALKTLMVGGTFNCSVTIEISEDGTDWSSFRTFTRPGSINLEGMAQQMRVRLDAFFSGTPNVDVGADDSGGTYAAMNVPVANGNGTALDTRLYGRTKTVIVAGDLGRGSLSIQGSEDQVDWQDVVGFTRVGHQTFEIEAQYMRVSRINVVTGAPTVTIGSSNDAEGIDGGIDLTAKMDGLTTNVYVDSINGDDGNDGLSTTTALASFDGLYRSFPQRALQNSRIIVHLAGVGGFGASATGVADYDTVNILYGGDGAPWGPTYVYRGPHMVAVVPATGPSTAALDVVPVVAVIGGSAAAGGTRSGRFDFTTAAPAWTVNDFVGSFLRITRAGVLVVFELPIHANTADTIVVALDGLATMADAILATDVVEIVRPGARFINDTDPPTGFDGCLISGKAASNWDIQDVTPAVSTGMVFTRVTWRSQFVPLAGSIGMEFDRCSWPQGVTAFFTGGTCDFINCSVGGIWLLGANGGGGGQWPNPDSATSPIVANRGTFMNCECETFDLGGSGISGGSYVIAYGMGCHSNAFGNDCFHVGGGGTVKLVEGKDLQGIALNGAAAGLRVNEGGTFICEGNVARAGSLSVEGATGIDLIVTEGITTAVPYGIGVGDFEEVAGWAGNLQRFPVTPGDLGDSSIITTQIF